MALELAGDPQTALFARRRQSPSQHLRRIRIDYDNIRTAQRLKRQVGTYSAEVEHDRHAAPHRLRYGKDYRADRRSAAAHERSIGQAGKSLTDIIVRETQIGTGNVDYRISAGVDYRRIAGMTSVLFFT